MSSSTGGGLERTERAVAGLLTALVVSLHVLRACSAGPLWRDEAAAMSVSQMSLDELLRYFQFEAFPPLFPLTLRAYTGLAGSGDGALRVFGLAVGLLVVAGLWLNARWLRRDVPLVSLMLVGPSATFLVFGDSIRGYGLGAVFIVSTFVCFGRLSMQPSAGNRVAALVSAVLSVQYLLANAVLLLAIGTSAAAVRWHRAGWRQGMVPLGIGALAGLSFLPHVPSYLSGDEWNVVFREDIGLAGMARRFATAASSPAPAMGAVWAAAALATVGGCGWLAQRWRHVAAAERSLVAYALSTSFLALAGTAVFLKILRYPTPDWYYIALLAVLACALDAAAGVVARQARGPRLARLLTLAVAFLLTPPAVAQVRERMTNLDLVAAVLRERARPRDFILVAPWPLGVSFRRYYDGATPWETLPPMQDLRTHRYDLLMAQMRLPDPLAPLRARIAETLQAGGRVWLVGGLEAPPPGAAPPRLAPAPHDPAGWSEGPYARSWSMQMVDFLRRHRKEGAVVVLPDAGPVQRLEIARLQVMTGWSGPIAKEPSQTSGDPDRGR